MLEALSDIGSWLLGFSLAYFGAVLFLLRSRKPDRTSPQASGDFGVFGES